MFLPILFLVPRCWPSTDECLIKPNEVPFNLVAWVSSFFCFVFGFKDTNLLKPRRLSLTIWVIAGICSCRNSAAELSQHLVFIADLAPSMQPSTTHQKVQQNQFWWWHCIDKFEGAVNRNPFSTNPVSWRQPVCLPYLPGVSLDVVPIVRSHFDPQTHNWSIRCSGFFLSL